ncbi:hypothetical protein Tco_0421115 [Tanacetum coccineum]
MGALATIQEGSKCTEETKAKADVFLHQHIDEMLEIEYLNCDDPSTLWKDLEIRFNNQRKVLLLSARDEWNNLRFQDFKRVNEYTSALFRICRTLRFSEKNNELLMKNHQSRPTGSLALPEENVVNNNDNKNSGSKRGRGVEVQITGLKLVVHLHIYGAFTKHLIHEKKEGHPGSTMRKRIVKNTHGYPLKDQRFSKMDKVPLCTSCSLGKLIVRPSPLKIENESPMFLERIQGPQRRLGIYVGYETSSIIRYVEPLTGDVFKAHFADCHFNKAIFPPLGGEKKTHEKDVSWSEPSLLYLDPRTKQSETEVQNIMHLQEIANQLPDAFTDTKRVSKSHIPAVNAPTRVEIPNKQAGDNIAQESQKRLKRGRPIGSKDKNPRKRKGTEKNSKQMTMKKIQTNILWDRNEIGDIDEIFSYSVASNIVGQSFGHHKGACPWLTENHLLSGYVKQGLVNPLAPRKDMVIENQIQLICKVVNHRTDLENIFTKKPYASGLASAYVS